MAMVAGDYARSGGSVLQATSALNQPKEIGILDRMSGLANGVAEMRTRLESFSSRLHATPTTGESANDLPPQGVRDILQRAEGELRLCLDLIAGLHDQL